MSQAVKNIADLRYVIVPARLHNRQRFAADQERIYEFWVRHWEKAFAETGAPEKGWKDHFLRQDYAVGLFCGNDVVACHLYTIYDLTSRASINGEYFHYVSDIALGKLRSMKMQSVLTMEYLGVHPDWRINSHGIGLGKLMVALGGKLTESLGVDGALGMPIGGTKVDKMMENVGGVTLQAGIAKYGYELKLLVIPTQPCAPSQDEAVRAVAERLWATRIDHSRATARPAEAWFVAA